MSSPPLLRLIQNASKLKTSKPKYALQISCHVKPNASPHREGITAIFNEKVDVAVAAAPKDGEANLAVSRVFADLFNVPKSTVDVIRGLKARDKTLSITDLEIGKEGEEEFLKSVRKKMENAIDK